MKKILFSTILWCFSMLIFGQTSENKYLIKFLETNTAQPDYGVTFLNDDQFVYKSPNTDKINTNSTKLSESNLFLATVGNEGDIIEKKEIQGLPTNKITKTGAAFAPDGKTVYFSAKKYRKKPRRNDKEQLFKADIDADGNWININKLAFSNDRYSFGEPSLSHNGKELYFTSDMPGGMGGADIYMVVIDSNDEFNEPVNLGHSVNTSGNEVTPYITKDNKLYFSSDNHHSGLGKLDIYYLDFNNPTNKPIHLDAPINSINDDFAFIINKNSDRGYFSSNRLQGHNNHDIYSFLVEKVQEEGPCVQAITGIVKDNGTKEIIRDAIITLYDDQNIKLEETRTDAQGKYSLILDCNKSYTLKAGAQNYNTEDHIVNTANYLEAPTLEANKFLIEKPVEEITSIDKLIAEDERVEKEVEEVEEIEESVTNNTASVEEDETAIKPVYFGFDRAVITSKAAKELDKLARILKNNKKIHVELSSYTDSRGSSAYNLKLSERRAKASMEYLVSLGIDKSRIKAKGYGESKMVNKCIDGIECSEAAHEKNRRTEFAFINPQASAANFDNNPVKEIEEVTKAKKQAPVKKVVEPSSYTKNIEAEKPNKKVVNEKEIAQTEISAVQKTKTKVEKTAKTTMDAIPVKTEKLNTETVAESNYSDKSKNEESTAKTSVDNTIKTTNKKEDLPASIVASNNQIENEEDTLSDEAKWLNSQIEKSNQEHSESENKEAIVNENPAESIIDNKPNTIEKKSGENIDKDNVSHKTNQLTKPVTNTSQSDEFNNLLATAKAEEKVEEKFNFERENESTTTSNSNVDPNQLLSDLKTKGASQPTSISKAENDSRLEDKKDNPTVGKAEVLSATQVSVKGMQSKRGKYMETDNAKRIHALRVIFRIQPNSSAERGYKDAYVVIKSPSGKIVNEKGVFKLINGTDQAYTDQTTIYYNRESIKAVMFIDKIVHKFTKGIYTVNIFIDGVEVGENILNLS